MGKAAPTALDDAIVHAGKWNDATACATNNGKSKHVGSIPTKPPHASSAHDAPTAPKYNAISKPRPPSAQIIQH